MPHVFLGERHVHMCLYTLSSIHLYLSALIFCSLSSPNISIRFRGSKTFKGKKSLKIHCTSLFLGTCLIQCGTMYSLSTCHPSLGILVVSFGLLWLVDVPV